MAKVWDMKKLKDLSDEEKKQLLQDAYDLGFMYERDYHGCPQAVFGALQELFGISEPMAFKAASGLAGGLGLSVRETCGALNGACLFYSMLYGRERDKIDDLEGKQFVAFAGCLKLRDKYLKEWNSATCREVMTEQMHRKGRGRRWFNIGVPEEREEFEKAGGHSDICPDVVGKACVWAAESILEKEREEKTG